MKRRQFLLAASAANTTQPPRGFAGSNWMAQQQLESKLRAATSPVQVERHMARMSAEPHHAGSPASRAVAEYARSQFSKFGFQARIEECEAFLPYPEERLVEIVSPVPYKLRLAEPNFAEDPDSRDKNQLPTYNAYSAAGDITAEAVYVNYGVPADYEVLRSKGISVKGKIALARYGVSWRGVKPKVAAENGAAGCLIFSDPKEDGFGKGAVYPDGPYRCDQGVQRGSVMDMSIHVGDPLSPGWVSEKGSRRLTMAEAKVLMPIPVMPISYGDAKPLLEQLGGDEVPNSWRGGLPVPYRFGPGPAKVRMKLSFDNATRPVHNVIATLRGSQWPDQWVLYGNHHDAWINGAQDPVSGAAALLETARVLGLAAKQGWKPKRTIVLALWDAEEFGLIGSTEWVEKHRAELDQKAVVYFNSDSNSRGQLSAGASPSLSLFLEEAARDTGVPRAKEWSVYPLGSGSDYVPFVHHTGIAAANIGFSGDVGTGGIYHSIFDSFAWYKRFGDDGFRHGKSLADYMATVISRMAEAAVPPFEFTRLAEAVSKYWRELKQDSASVDAAIARLTKAAAAFETRYANAQPMAVAKVERALQIPGGLPGREWYRSVYSAPGQYTGYGAKTLPGVREALELKKPAEAEAQIEVLAAALNRCAAAIEAL
ncbi:MAG: M28 family peptidase [Acidobacteria bacterium]|nr:M28 family peptidase [Acidobacteriota bacterium]